MRLCVSNIAWTPAQDEAALALLADEGVGLIELAPTRWWPDLSRVDDAEVETVRTQLERFGLRAWAFQAVLFGKSELAVFRPNASEACREYLESVIDLAARMGVIAVVFGSPKNRLREGGSDQDIEAIATDFFRRLGDHAASRGVRFCFEPNPAHYGADFGCTLAESMDLVRRVNSPGFLLNVDAGAIALNQENPEVSLPPLAGRIGHYHISEPYLGPYSTPQGDHSALARALGTAGYDGVVSIEMKAQDNGLASVTAAIRFARNHYPC